MKARSGETIVASESGNDYDLYLIKTGTTHKLIVFMKVQFFFEDSGNNSWTQAQKTAFVSAWQSDIQSAWGTPTLTNDKAGAAVALEFRFHTQIDGWMWDHWELTVTKIGSGGFQQSWVRNGMFFNSSQLDSEDVRLTAKGHGQSQRGTVHEFGHMLGLGDEYNGGAHNTDYRSVMNRGEHIYPRHRQVLKAWADKQL